MSYSYTANCIYGYFGKKVNVFTHGKLVYIPYGQCGYRKEGDWIILISYESEILRYNPVTNDISFEYSDASPDYSRTTARHVNAFCKQFIPAMSYHSIKKLYYEWKEDMENKYLKELANFRKEDEDGYIKNDKYLLRDF